MKHLSIVASLALIAGLIFHLPIATAQTLPEVESARVNLPNGWSLTPVGDQVRLGDLPLNIAVSPSQEMAAVTNNGRYRPYS